MITPTTVTEQLLFSTVRLQVDTPAGVATGTAFRFDMPVGDGRTVPLIFTNKHVVKSGIMGRFVVHELAPQSQPPAPSGSTTSVQLGGFEALWVQHPSPDVDLCAMPLGPLTLALQGQGKTLFMPAFGPSVVPTGAQLQDLTAVEDVLMVGYPAGLWDDKNNLPLIRRGSTASHPAIDHRGEPQGVVDMACFGGSSGSPIVLFNQGTYPNREGGATVGSRFFLLGVLHAGPVMEANGQITIRDIPTVQQAVVTTQVMIHLGYYVKAREVLALGNIVLKQALAAAPLLSAPPAPSVPPP